MEIEIETVQSNNPDISITSENSEIVENTNEIISNTLSPKDKDDIIKKVISNYCDYLTEISEFDHMRDNVINTRTRELMLEQYASEVENTINKFEEFLKEDESILEYIENNNSKLIYGSGNDIDEIIYETVFYETPYSNDMAQGWLSWDNHYCRFTNNNNFLGQEVITNDIIKFVFEKYGTGYEFIQPSDNISEYNTNNISDNDSTDDAEDNMNKSDSADNTDNENKKQNNDECTIC